MNVGIVGLGKMGEAIAYRLIQAGQTVYGYDVDAVARDNLNNMGGNAVSSLEELASQARVFWLMVPIKFVKDVVKDLQPHLKEGDIIIDGGNSFYKDSIERTQALENVGIIFLDCGTSGGLAGRAKGFCLMVGGDPDAYTKVHSLLAAIAAPGAVAHMGPSGTGHYVKMVHNGIEYGMMQAYAEGFEILKEGSFKDIGLDLEEISRIWNISAVIRSYLLGLAHNVFQEDYDLEDISGKIYEGGTGKWTVEEAKKHDIRVPVLEDALETRAWSRKTGGNYATKLIAMLRHEFGGHTVKKSTRNNENY